MHVLCASLFTTVNAQTACTAPTFWILNGFRELHELELSADTVINHAIIYTNVPGRSLAYCNNLNGGDESPTFYTSNDYTAQAWYYNDTGWVEFDGTSGNYFLNSGGNGNYLYFLDNGNVGRPLYYYSAGNFDTIFTSSTLPWTVADVAVDDSGYAWCFLGHDNPYITTDSIYVFSPTGQIVHQYAFSMITAGAYGATFINGALYLGIESSQTYVNKLYRLTLNGNTMTAGQAISLPYLNSTDMASCNNHPALSGVVNIPVTSPVRLFPNPANSVLNIVLQEPCAVSVFNVTGQQIYYKPLANGNLNMDVSSFADGLYFLQATTPNGQHASQKFSVAR